MPRPIITLLTDFGQRDHYVASMKGVMLGICPDARFVDISHEIEPFNIRQAAWTLSQTWQCFPPGTIHLVVVDPGVGSTRRAIAASAAGQLFVGPDNGVLAGVLETDPARKVFHLTDSGYFRNPVSHTFHGRDIFAPSAAHLAAGLPVSSLGGLVKDAVRLLGAEPIKSDSGGWTGCIVSVDRFGNMVTNFRWEEFQWVGERPFEMSIGTCAVTVYRRHYSQGLPGEYFVMTGSGGHLEISLNGSDAAGTLGARPGISVKLRSVT